METIELTTEKQAIQIVTIKSLSPLYKEGQPAAFIELANCEEHGFNIVVQKGLYEVGDKAIYVQPDYCLPLMGENPTLAQKMFADFTAPSGEAKKSKLGKNGRIRAVKFNFNTEPNGLDPVYSMGVMLPLLMVMSEMELSILPDDLDTALEVIKYEEPEGAYSGLAKGDLPVGMYMTDETNIFNSLRNLENHLPANLTGSLKVDGSSISIYVKSESDNGICSRKLEKKLEQKIISGFKDGHGNKLRKHYIRETGQKGYFNEATSEFFTDIPESYIPIEEEVDDTFTKLGMPVLEKLKVYCLATGQQLALRGELCGQGLKGSGNKNNPHAALKQQILFYGLDDYSSGVTIKQPVGDFLGLCDKLGIETCPVVFSQVFNSLDELKEKCETYFKTNMVEGIVVRSDDSRFSAKYMNAEYDSRK
jgi:hypothetical protein